MAPVFIVIILEEGKMIFSRLIFIFLIFVIISCSENKDPYRTALLGKFITNFEVGKLTPYNTRTLYSQICSNVTSVDKSLNIIGDLALDWTIKGSVYSFKINTKRIFSTGEKVSAYDIKYSLERFNGKKDLEKIKEIRVLSDEDIEIELHRPDIGFLYLLSRPKYCVINRNKPSYVVSGNKVTNSAGSYRIKEINDDYISLTVNKYFMDKAIEKEINVYFLSQDQAIDKFNKGELDDLSFYLLEKEDFDKIKRPYKKITTNLFWTWAFVVNHRAKNLKTLEEKANFLKLIDINQLKKDWGSDIDLGGSFIPKGMSGHLEKPSYPSVKNSINCKRDVFTISIIKGIPQSDNLKKALLKQLENVINCQLVIRLIPMGKWTESRNKDDDINIFGLHPSSTDSITFYRYFIYNHSASRQGYSSEEVNKLYERLSQLHPLKRDIKDLRRLDSLIYEKGFAKVIGYPRFSFVYGKNVKWAHMNSLGMHLNKWWKIGR